MIDSILLVALLISLITDVRSRKILNIVTLPGIVLGLIINTWFHGFHGLLLSGEGFLVGIGLLLIPFILGGIGAGDVKLLAVVGTLKGPAFVFYSFIYIALIGGLIALAILIWKKRLGQILWKFVFDFLIMKNLKASTELQTKQDVALSFPYGIAIVIGTCTAYVWGGFL